MDNPNAFFNYTYYCRQGKKSFMTTGVVKPNENIFYIDQIYGSNDNLRSSIHIRCNPYKQERKNSHIEPQAKQKFIYI